MVVLLDSTVIAGFLDRDDPLHGAADRRLRDLAGHHSLIASALSHAELLTGAALCAQRPAAVEGFFADLIERVAPVDERIGERALRLCARRASLRLADALILATAESCRAGLAIGSDRRWTQVPGLRVDVELLAPLDG